LTIQHRLIWESELKKQKKSKGSFENRTEYYDSIEIKGFRSFKNLKLKDLGDINLFLGPNNCGKTSILETVFSHSCGLNFMPFRDNIIISAQRQIQTSASVLEIGENIYSLYNDTKSLPLSFSISAKLKDDQQVYETNYRFSPSSAISELDPINLGHGMPLSSSSNGPKSDHFPDLQQNESGSIFNPQSVINSVLIGNFDIDINGIKQRTAFSFPPLNENIRSPFKLTAFNVKDFIHIGSRKIHIAGMTPHPDEEWMKQMARRMKKNR